MSLLNAKVQGSLWASEPCSITLANVIYTCRIVFPSSDLGIGIRVAGGVRCEKCGALHTVITDVTTTDLPNLYKGQRNNCRLVIMDTANDASLPLSLSTRAGGDGVV